MDFGGGGGMVMAALYLMWLDLEVLASALPDPSLGSLCTASQVQQDKEDATSIVEKRLEYINGEMKRLDKQLKDIEEKQVLQHAWGRPFGGRGGAGDPLPWAVAWSRGQPRMSVHSVGLGPTLGATG